MVDFIQKRFFKKTRSFHFLSDGLLRVVRKSLLHECAWTVSLAHVNPEYRQVKVSSQFWFCVLFGGLIGMALVLLSYYFNHSSGMTNFEFIGNFIVYLVSSIIGGASYLYSKVDYTVFNYEYEGEPLAFGLFTDNPNDVAYGRFISDLQEQIQQARFEQKERDFERANAAIDYLAKEQVINESVSTILQYRLDDMNYFANE